MKWVLALILLIGAINRSEASEPTGFIPDAAVGPAVKLDGLIMQHVPGGYLALSVPKRYIVEFIAQAAKLEPHMAMIEVLERLDRESKKLVPASRSAAVPLGICYLATDEDLPRHKILERFVRNVGTYTYLNRREELVSVLAYAGRPAGARQGQ